MTTDAIHLLKQEHERIRDLLDAVTRTYSPQLHRLLLAQTKAELEAHCHAEETIFYPALENFGELTLRMKSSYLEHVQQNTLLQELMELGEGDEFQLKLLRLIQLVDSHFEEEESEIFVKVEELMTHADRERIGSYMVALKDPAAAAAANF